MIHVKYNRRPKTLTLLFCVPVILVVAVAVAGSRGAASISSDDYPNYFDHAFERYQSTKIPADSQPQIDLMTIALRRMHRQNMDGERVLNYADAVDRQLTAINSRPGPWSNDLVPKVNAQNTFSDQLIEALALENGPDQANEAALALLYEIPKRMDESHSDPRIAGTYLDHSLHHFRVLKPDIRIRLLDAYVALSVLESKSISEDFGRCLLATSSTLKQSLSRFEIDNQTERLLETIDELIDSPDERDLVVGILEREPLFFGSIARASIMGDWSSTGNQLGSLAIGEGTTSEWYRRNSRLLGSLVSSIFLDRYERGAKIDHQWLAGLDIVLRLDGATDDLPRLIQSIVNFDGADSSLANEEYERKNMIIEVMDGNPASDTSLLVRILRGSKILIASGDAASIKEALEVADLLNAKVLPLLVQQSFWELRMSSEEEPHIGCTAVRQWVKHAESRASNRDVTAALESYAGYAYYLSAKAALEGNEPKEAVRLVAMSKTNGGPVDGIALLEARINELSSIDQMEP